MPFYHNASFIQTFLFRFLNATLSTCLFYFISCTALYTFLFRFMYRFPFLLILTLSHISFGYFSHVFTNLLFTANFLIFFVFTFLWCLPIGYPSTFTFPAHSIQGCLQKHLFMPFNFNASLSLIAASKVL